MADDKATTEPIEAAVDGGERVLVAYASRHGSTRGIAQRLGQGLRRAGLTVDVLDVREVGDLNAYRAAVVGAPVYDGQWPPEADEFLRGRRGALLERPVWLFSVGSFGDTKRVVGPLMRREPRNIAEVQRVLSPRDYRVFAGIVERDMWPFWSRVFFHAFGGRLGDHRDWNAIDAWAGSIGRQLA